VRAQVPRLSLERGLPPRGTDGRDLLVAVEQALTITSTRELPSLLRYVLDKISEMVEMVWAATWVFREDEDAWVVAASLGLTPEAAGIRFRSGTALPCRVGETGTPLLINDLGSCEFHRSTEEHYRMRSAVYAPMKVGARTVGVIAIYADRTDCYTEQDLALLTGLGEHLGVTVAFAIMEDRAKRIAVLEERDRHARDLHDGVQQVLSSLRIYALEARKALVAGDPGTATKFVDACATSIAEASDELQRSIATMRQHDDAFSDIYEAGARMRRRLSAAGVDAELHFDHLALEPATSDALSWICREAATNVLKHSNARSATLELHAEDDSAVLTVADDGVGIVPEARQSSRGLHIGLQVMRERAAQVDGELSVLPGPRTGVRVRCRVPIALRD
jgi:signal transduction histidine kinase